MLRPRDVFLALAGAGFFAVPVLKADLISAGSAFALPSALFGVPISISGATNVFDFQFDVAYDPAVVRLESVAEGPFLLKAGSTTFFPGFIDNLSGTATFIADALNGPGPGAAGNGTLVFLYFQAIASGTSSLTLANVILQDPTGADIPFTTAGGTVSVAVSIPEPDLSAAKAACLVLLAVSRRRVFKETARPD